MKGGRLENEEKDKRFRLLAGFIFNFRYATSKQIHTFAQLIMNMSSSKWLVNSSVKEGYLDYYFDTTVMRNIYYLTQKGKDLIDDDETLANHYFFKKTSAGINTFIHHSMVVQTYFLLKSHLNIKEWISEEVIRIGKKRREKIPDAVILLPNGVKIALEAETKHKKLAILKSFVMRYRYDIEKMSRYDTILVVASCKRHYDGLVKKFLKISPDFFNKRIILTDIAMLEHGVGYYQGESRHLEDALSLLKKG